MALNKEATQKAKAVLKVAFNRDFSDSKGNVDGSSAGLSAEIDSIDTRQFDALTSLVNDINPTILIKVFQGRLFISIY